MNQPDEIDQLLREQWDAPPPPSVGLRDRVLAAVAAEDRPAHAKRAWARRITAMAAAAAVVLVATVTLKGRHVLAPPAHAEVQLSQDDERFVFADDDDDDDDETALYDVAAASAGE